MTLTEGQASDCKGAALLMDALPEAKELLANRGYDADWFRDALLARGITPCIPPGKNRKRPICYDKNLYKQRHKFEIMFGRIKDWENNHALRPLRTYILFSSMPRSFPHFLSRLMRSEPRVCLQTI